MKQTTGLLASPLGMIPTQRMYRQRILRVAQNCWTHQLRRLTLAVEGEAMDEAEWLEGTDPQKMLAFLTGRTSERKLRLFACACCRRIWPLVEREGARYVEAAERHADRLLSDSEMTAAAWLAERRAREEAEGREWRAERAETTAAVAAATRIPMTVRAAQQAAREAMEAAADVAWGGHKLTPYEESRSAQANLLRCIAGSPFQPFSLDPAVLASQGGIVVRLASAIYNDRRGEDMPLLGDCLEEAGCSDRDVLEHCRRPGQHARGCHVVDAILGKS